MFDKPMSHRQKNWWKTFHLLFVSIWFAGGLGALLLAVLATKTRHIVLIFAAHYYIQYFDWFLIIPGGLGTILTGIWLAARTNWGLAKYYWIIVKLLANIGIILFGGIKMRLWIHETVPLILANRNNTLQNAQYLHNREMLVIGLSVSLGVLIFLMFISVFKPWGPRGKNGS
ncbi:Hypothetical protein LUCI_2557 [Lucifera butyrica]|uniref:DUF2269 domain-containing protein n=1 Tax=Lucifera butyrica TaxID=1351585 RepID=A0A498RB05_9FIRM|nr:DUF2269 family protein [Lucifera butyrica]VBB07313.1 Hypothetical protein LUCI_2557 [Lucifera butyrica]